MNRLKLLAKVRQDKYWEVKTNGEQNAKLMKYSATDCLIQSYTQVF
jgi:hypothetical protein